MKKAGKVCVIGAGAVGSNIAYGLILRNIASDVALIDVNKNLVESEILDIKHGFSEIWNGNIYLGDYSDVQDSDIVVVTAGRGRKPGETRLDMVKDNIEISDKIIGCIQKYYNNNIIIVVSNPVDILTYKFCQTFGFHNGSDVGLIFGTGCVLDTSRLIFSLADYLKCKIADIETYVIGEHGDSQVVVWSKTKVCGLPIADYCRLNKIVFESQNRVDLEKKVKTMGAKIIGHKGKTHYGISTSVCYIIEKLFSNQVINVNVSTCLNNEYGLKDVALSLPTLIDNRRAQKIVWQDIDKYELEKLNYSANSLKDILKNLGV